VETHPGASFGRQREAGAALGRVLQDFAREPAADLIVSCANGTFVDRAEAAALGPRGAEVRRLAPKLSFGEAPGASALLQTVLAAVALEKLQLTQALVPVIGWNQQVGAARVSRADGPNSH
jgi:hypothetical protein